MRRYRLTLTLALAALLGLLANGAARADTGVAVLGIEPVEVPEPLAQALTDALRQRAAATAGVRTVPGKDLVELKMIFGCDGEQAACMAQAGRSLGADKLLYGMLKRQGKTGNVIVALKLLDVASGTIEKFVNETVPKKELAGGNVNAAAARWFGALVEVEAKPTLTVTTTPPNAALSVDGQQAGRTPVTLRDLSAGNHTLDLKLQGYAAVERSIELRPGGNHEIKLDLAPEAPVASTPPQPVTPSVPQAPQPLVTQTPPPPPSGHPGRVARGLAIGAFAAAVVAGGVAIYTWRTYNDLENKAHNDLKALAPQANASNQSFFNHPTCNPPAGLSGAQTYKDHCSSGQSYTNATTALWVTAGVLAAAGVVGVIVGDRQAKAAQEKKEKKSAARLMQESLRIEPVFSTQAGGLSASFEF